MTALKTFLTKRLEFFVIPKKKYNANKGLVRQGIHGELYE